MGIAVTTDGSGDNDIAIEGKVGIAVATDGSMATDGSGDNDIAIEGKGGNSSDH